MDFIINHSGFLFGIVIVAVLAIIGYYADKKDKSKISNVDTDNNKDINSDLNDVSIPTENSASFDELPNASKKLNDDVNDTSISNNAVGVPDIVSQDLTTEYSASNSNFQFGLNDFESLNMSLEDLEKKNFDKISKSSISNNDENFYYSDMEEPSESVLTQNNISDVSSDKNKVLSDTVDNLSSESNSSDLSNHDLQIDINNDIINNNETVASDQSVDSSHVFDNETESIEQNDEESEEFSVTGSNTNNDFSFMQDVQSDINNSVPELVDANNVSSNDDVNDGLTVNSDTSSSALNDSINEDIWKF